MSLATLAGLTLLPVADTRGDTTKRTFDVPAGEAVTTLKVFALQANQQILYSPEDLADVRTVAVRGSYLPIEALRVMLEGTPLSARLDRSGGAIGIRGSRSPRGPPARWSPPSSPPLSPSPSSLSTSVKKRTALSLLSGWLALAGGSIAQNTPANDAAAGEADTIVLTPFTVRTSRDTGYIANDTLVGGRTNTQLIRTPADVSVLTKDFLNDIGATSYLDAVPYMTSAVIPSPIQAADFGNTVSFRGMPAGFQARNYFRVLFPIDAYMVDRIESVRGANALLFGDGAVGGTVNTLTKRAKIQQSFQEVQVQLDSEGSRRATADVNQALGHAGAVRVNLVGNEGRSWVESYYADSSAANVSGTYQFNQKTSLFVEAEYGDSKTAYAPTFVQDFASLYDGSFAVTGPLSANPDPSTGVSRVANDTLVFSPSLGGVINLRNFGVSTGTNLAITPELRPGVPLLPRMPRDFSVQPRNASENIRYFLVGTSLQFQATESLSFELAAQLVNIDRRRGSPYFNGYRIDVNQVLPDGTPNPKFRRAYSDATWGKSSGDNFNTDLRLAMSYKLPLELWEQRVNASVTQRAETYDVQNYVYGRSNNPAVPLISSSANVLQYRVYWDDPRVDLTRPVSGAGGYTYEYVPTVDLTNRQRFNSAQVATVSSIWDERISLIGGARRDQFRQRQWNIDASGNDSAGRTSRRSVTAIDQDITTVSYGFVFFPIHALGVYANYSESFNPPLAGITLDGSQARPTDSFSKSGGVRFRLFDNRIVGSVGVYKIEEAGRGVAFPSTEINRIWNQLGRSERQFPASTYQDTLDFIGEGAEVDVVANVTKNFRLKFSYARPETKQANSLAGLRGYLAANLATWSAPNDPVINADILTLQNRIVAANDGRSINNTPDYIWSVFGNYTVPSGWAKDFRVSVGVTAQGPLLIGNEVGRPFDYVKSDGYETVSLSFGYPVRFAGHKLDLQLRISNLLDFDDPIYNGTATYQGRTIRNNFSFIEPRKATLIATYRF